MYRYMYVNHIPATTTKGEVLGGSVGTKFKNWAPIMNSPPNIYDLQISMIPSMDSLQHATCIEKAGIGSGDEARPKKYIIMMNSAAS